MRLTASVFVKFYEAKFGEAQLPQMLYEHVLETQKLSLDDLAPRIKKLKAKQNNLMKTRVQTEADMVLEGVQHVNADTVKAYAQDLRN